MQYRNKKTGAKINSPCVISGGDWIEVKPEVTEKEEKKPTKSKKKK